MQKGVSIIIKKDFHVDLSNIQAKDENDAFSKVCRCVDRICKVLTILLQFQNFDGRENSPNLTYLPKNITFIGKENNAENFCDNIGKNTKFLVDRFGFREKVALNITEEFDFSDFSTIYSLISNPNDLAFGEIIYRATLSKNIESRFFQLFTIIEAIETKYGDDEAIGHKMLQESALDKVDFDLKKSIGKLEMDMEMKKRLISRLEQILKNATIEPRAEKLKKIVIEKFKITKIEKGLVKYSITEEKMQEFINARNRLFHGGKSKEKTDLIKLTNELQELCLNLIRN